MTAEASVWSILLIGGSEEEYVFIRKMLDEIRGDGYSLYWHKEMLSSVHLLSSGLYDVAVVKYHDLPGDSLCLLKKAKKHGAQIKWIMLTDWDLPHFQQTMFKQGANAFLSKKRLTKADMSDILTKVIG